MPRNFENNSSRPDFSNFKPKHKSEISSRRLLGDDPDNNNSGKRGFRPAFGIDSPDSEEESLIPQAQSTMVRDRHDSQTSWNAKLLEKNKDSNPFSLRGKGGDSKRKFSRSRSRDSRSPPRRRGGRSRSRTPRSRSRSPYYPNGKKRQNYSRSPPARRRFSRSPPRRRRDSPPRSRYDQGLGPRGRYPKTRAGPVDLGPRTNDDFDVVKGKNVPDFITGTRHPEQRIRKKDPYALPGMNSRSRSRDSEPNAPIGPVDRDSRDSRSRSRDSRSKSRSRSRSRSLPSRYVRRSRTRSPPVKRETNNYGYGRSLRKSRSRSRSPLPPRRRFSPSRSRSPPRRKNKVKNSPPPARRDRSITPLESLEREHRQKYNRNDSRNRDSLERNGRRDRRRRSRSLSTEKAFARLSVTRKIESRSPSRSRSPPRNRSSAKNNSRKSPEIIRKVRDIRSRSRSRSNSRSRSSAKNRVETSRNASPSGRISAKDRLGIKKNNKDRRDNDNRKSGRDDHAYSSKNIRNQTRDEERLGIPSKKIPTDDPNRVRGQCRFVDKNGRVKRHIKNTESFEPNYIPMQMRVRSVSYQENKKYPFEFAHNDSVLVNDMYYDFKADFFIIFTILTSFYDLIFVKI